MRYLKPKILYPDHNMYDMELITRMRKEYNDYLESCVSLIDKNLYDLYLETESLHDYKIKRISYENNEKNSLELILTDYDEEKEVILIFRQVYAFNCRYKVSKEDFLFFENESEEIIISEIGYIRGKNYLSLYTQKDTNIDIYFGQLCYQFLN